MTTAKLRVAHVAQPTTAGVPNVILSLVRDQVERGLDVHVVCPDEGYLAARAYALGASVHTWSAGRSPSLKVLRETIELRRILKDLGPDLVHLHSAKAGLVGRLVNRGRIPTIYQPHAWSFHAARGVLGYLTTFWERHSARWAHALVAVSHDEAKEGKARKVVARYRVIPNGLDLQLHASRDPTLARHDLGLRDVPTAVCIGRLCEQKGQDKLLAVWPSVLREVPSAQLLLVGDGPDRPSLTRQARGHSSIIFVGEQVDVRPWISAASVVVLPSRWEAGVSLAAMEAMAGARSVVLSAVAGSQDSAPNLGAAVIAQSADSDLARAIVMRLKDLELAKREGQEARSIAERHFNRSDAVASMFDLYMDLIFDFARETLA